MKAFQKLALVSAIAMTSSAFALEAADDATLAAATGQDGITILVAPGTMTRAGITDDPLTVGTVEGLGVSRTTFDQLDLAGPGGPGADLTVKGLSINQVVVHDDDGLGTLGVDATANSGALVIGDGTAGDSTVVFADNTLPIRIDIDMVGNAVDASAGNGAMLNVRISTPTLAIKQGSVYVANSDAAPDDFDADGVAAGAPDADTLDDANGSSHSGRIKIMNGMEIVLGATVINVQLGREAQGNMVSVNASIIGGLTINNLETLDQGGAIRGGGIRADSLSIKDSAGANLTANVVADVAAALPGGDTSGGLVATIVSLGDAGGANLTLVNQRLGSATSPVMGDIQINGLNLAGTQLIIRGH